MAGTYTITVTDANNCSGTASTTVIVNNPPVVTATSNSPVCTGSALSLTGGPCSMTTYAWSGPNSFSNATQSPAVSASATTAMAGTYSLTVTDANGCSGTASTVVVVNTTPSITSTTPAAICGTGTVNLSAASSGTINWYAALTGGASLGTGISFTTPSISTTTTYYVDATSGSCTSSPRIAVMATVYTPPTATASSNSPVCSGSALSLTGGPGSLSSYAWSGPNSFSNATQSPAVSVSATAAMAGTYTITVTDANGCSGTASTVVIVTSSLPVSVSIAPSANPVCNGASVLFTATPANGGTSPAYQWKVNSFAAGTNSTTYSYTPANLDAVTCVLTSNVTCPSGNPATSNTVLMTVNPIPATPVITQSNDSLLSNYASGNQWYYNEAASTYSIAGATNQYYVPYTSGNYFVIVTDSAGCVSDSSNIINVVLTGISGINGTDFGIFPNPSNGMFTISFDSKYYPDATVTLINAIGQPLLEDKLVNHTIIKLDVSFLPQGMYFMKFETYQSVYLKKVLVVR
jgi:hypothetical protein